MADPLSITASVLAVLTAAIQSTRSLHETVGRFKKRDKTLGRLEEELSDLVRILDSLHEVIGDETSTFALLVSPVERCSKLCREFEKSMEQFTSKSKTGFRDWAKMEFMRGDINEFIDALAGYKSTISVGLGTITMHASKVSQKVLEEYNEMIKDTAYNLEMHLQRVDEKMALYTMESTNASDTSIDLRDEKAVTEQCLRICEDASSYIDSLTKREPSLAHEVSSKAVPDNDQNQFEAQLLTRQVLDGNRDSLAESIGRLRERLDSLNSGRLPGSDQERSRLQEEIDTLKQCLEMCKRASSQVSNQKIYRIGEVVADGDSDQVVVTTLADLFDIKKALSKDRSAQLIGSMTDETLRQMSVDRYKSRFGALVSPQVAGTNLQSTAETPRLNTGQPNQTSKNDQQPAPEVRRSRPFPNEVRKRTADGD